MNDSLSSVAGTFVPSPELESRLVIHTNLHAGTEADPCGRLDDVTMGSEPHGDGGVGLRQ
ncbi:MAG: hypothetical protein JWR37_2832 [Mycobacterium sp.]|jgi:hypothetical protein|nr:hypothetical protein [Mycobacterium sp.]